MAARFLFCYGRLKTNNVGEHRLAAFPQLRLREGGGYRKGLRTPTGTSPVVRADGLNRNCQSNHASVSII